MHHCRMYNKLIKYNKTIKLIQTERERQTINYTKNLIESYTEKNAMLKP